MLKPTNILVPTDFSEHSDRALEQALDIAGHYNARVYLFHVIHQVIYQCVVDYSLSAEIVEDLKKKAEDAAYDGLKKQLEKFPQSKEVEVRTGIATGIIYDEILREAEEKKIDLIVIASLGQSGIAKYLIGGVTRNVLKGARCPVLLTR
ncbi:MAG: putative universal stress protein [Syntrophorhabdus sp. PtaU1.Bin058]|nr:MAG: putative universal stress protein [Syntrophorhabdus sp. PtaU1.Bin058]